MVDQDRALMGHLVFLYGEEQAKEIFPELVELLDQYKRKNPDLLVQNPSGKISERDVVLITYGDMVHRQNEMPLRTLGDFLKAYLADVVNTIHLLPFYPYSSDDGFSVIDYRRVNSDLGDWKNVLWLSQDFRLMFDAVINHCSSQSAMFQGFLEGDPKFENYFTVVKPGTNLSKVFRPRATPVVTPYTTVEGEKLVWTTFSADQVDLNYKNPEVLFEVVDILLFYATNGAEFIRFDAVTYVWKESGTNCINLPQTHRLVQLMRAIMDRVAPNVVIITETNVPHKENIAYFGDGTNEAQMVYNFALPLLTLYSFLAADVTTLSNWANTLSLPSNQTAFFNFLACHDGIGILPVAGILTDSDIGEIVGHVKNRGGFISYKSNEDGTQSPYELNINYLDALSDGEVGSNPDQLAKRFLASQAIMLALRGIPGIYFHSLFGSRNWLEGVAQTGRNRTINREKLDVDELTRELSTSNSLRALIYYGFRKLLRVRQENPAFHPFGEQEIITIHPAVFSLTRISPDGSSRVLCLHNVTGETVSQSINLSSVGLPLNIIFESLLCGVAYRSEDGYLALELKPYEVLWLKV